MKLSKRVSEEKRMFCMNYAYPPELLLLGAKEYRELLHEARFCGHPDIQGITDYMGLEIVKVCRDSMLKVTF